MFPFLLWLLLQEPPGIISAEVCFSMSKGILSVDTLTNASVTTLNIMDDLHLGVVRCSINGLSCFVECIINRSLEYQYNTFCLRANMTAPPLEFTIQSYWNCNTYLCKETTILPLIESVNKSDSQQSHLIKLFTLREMCPQLFSENHNIKMAFINKERQMIHDIMSFTELQPGESRHYNLRDLALNVVSISDANVSSASPSEKIQIEYPQLLPQNKSFVPQTWLPVDALSSIPEAERIVGLVSYMQHNHFQFKQENISSMVIRTELLGGEHLHDLKTAVEMNFNVSSFMLAKGFHFKCHYFNEEEWLWKTDGCETDRTSNNTANLLCSCNHTTPFAVLLIRDSIEAVHWKILSYISYIGCSLSAFFAVLSLLLYIFSRNHRMDNSVSIHVSLSGALLLLNTSFLLMEWGATVKPEWVCEFIAAVTHYSLLCCFTWMAIEGLHLYLLLIKVFNTYYKNYFLKLSVAGWGIPGVIVATTWAVKDFKQFYGFTEITMTDSNQTSAICWITDKTFSYSLNLLYFTLIFIFNIAILVVVASSICRMKGTLRIRVGAEAKGNTKTCRSGLTVLGLSLLMGITWGLAFLGSGHVNYPVLYLFCILNSAQGFFIFLWICLSTRKQRQKQLDARTILTPVKSSTAKPE
ncbi:adhesion G-protein coupled receptor G5-like [Genypterus blacodes]|uniref:adhesion G-protein coupled receptor G5-like n=1 Tax=Genypterus blacodes TaxID=154954 RepID=UPI003F75C42A